MAILKPSQLPLVTSWVPEDQFLLWQNGQTKRATGTVIFNSSQISNKEQVTFLAAPATTEFKQTEGGLMTYWDLNWTPNPSNATDIGDGYKLGRFHWMIRTYISSTIDGSELTKIATSLSYCRANGIKVILRFVYDETGTNDPADATLVRALGHIGQIGPIVRANKDVIAWFEAGFIGHWGEWHAGTINQTTWVWDGPTNMPAPADREAIIEALLEHFPSDRYLSVRQLWVIREWLDVPPTPADWGTDTARIAFHNDAYMGNSTDAGTYLKSGDKDFAIAMSGSGAPFNVEFWPGYPSQRATMPEVLVESAQLGLTALNRYGGLNSVREDHDWSQQDYDTFVASVGYRPTLISCTHDFTIANNRAEFSVTLVNKGFARFPNSRHLWVRLVNGSDVHFFKHLGNDCRELAPDVPTTWTFEAEFPEIPEGTYQVQLGLPDKEPSLELDPKYNARFTNSDNGDQVWFNGWLPTGSTISVEVAESSPYVYGPELLVNGDFSSGSSNWTAIRSTLTVANNSLLIRDAEGDWPGARTSSITVTPGDVYELSGYVGRGNTTYLPNLEIRSGSPFSTPGPDLGNSGPFGRLLRTTFEATNAAISVHAFSDSTQIGHQWSVAKLSLRKILNLPEGLRPAPVTQPSLTSQGKPAVGVWTDFDGLDTQIMRLTDGGPIHDYSNRAAFNADQTKIILTGSGKPYQIRNIDGTVFRSSFSTTGQIAFCDPVNPDIIWLQDDSGSRVGRYSIANNTSTMVTIPGNYDSVVIGRYEGPCSDDGRYFALCAEKTGDNRILIFDASTDTVVNSMPAVFGSGYVDNAMISPSGKYLLVQTEETGKSGIQIYDRETLTLLRTVGSVSHTDVGYRADGDECLVQQIDDQSIVSIRLSDGDVRLELRGNILTWSNHVSCRNIRRPGYAYVSMFYNEADTRPLANEIFALRLDGRQMLERWGQSMFGSSNDYDFEAHACASPEGDYVIFNSGWGTLVTSEPYLLRKKPALAYRYPTLLSAPTSQYPEISQAQPSLNTPVQFGSLETTVTRISDANGWMHHYATWQAFSADQSKILLGGNRILSTSDWSLLRTVSIGMQVLFWDPIDSDILWAHDGHGGGNRIRKYSYSANDYTTYTLSGYSDVSIGMGEGSISADGRYLILCALKTGDTSPWLLVFDTTTGTVTGTLNLPGWTYGGSGLDNAHISPSGNYVVVSSYQAGNKGHRVYDRATLTYQRAYTGGSGTNASNGFPGHMDIGYRPNGDEVLVRLRNDGGLVTVRLSDGNEQLEIPGVAMSWGNHVSCRNTLRPGYAYVSMCYQSDQTSKYLYREIIAVRLDGTGRLERWGQAMFPTNGDYNYQAKAVASPNGDKVLMTSGWGTTTSREYILQVPETMP